jgi:hypothetical protein
LHSIFFFTKILSFFVEDHFSHDTYWVSLSSLVLFFVRLLLDPYIGLSLCIAPSIPKITIATPQKQTAIALNRSLSK